MYQDYAMNGAVLGVAVGYGGLRVTLTVLAACARSVAATLRAARTLILSVVME